MVSIGVPPGTNIITLLKATSGGSLESVLRLLQLSRHNLFYFMKLWSLQTSTEGVTHGGVCNTNHEIYTQQ